ncbi:Peptidase S28 [Caenorhabditis elegans]|uniref:Peptidase S28 n=1 Tax=Caenorhabditis elegans TaxID=6239 RepID=O02252_CAEEL|nr:Peptidase S28 [Caenorhabditis elegans]CAB05185.2 Peptidase S28 [Caenorhabditis elegans]|eukprot:NP_501598.2 Prolyl Carboxy Peptidase like [Caenorhabditis elegans]
MLRNLLLLAVLAAVALAIIPNHYHFKEHLNKGARKNGNIDASITAGYMLQSLDHFIGNASGTFSQRYFYTQQYTLHQRTAFLYVSADGVEEAAVISDERNPIVKTAKQFGATIFSLEHRYYGQSRPNFDKFDAQNLRHLNSLQAILDIISFIKSVNVQFNMDPDVRWVLWGAGYGGILAAEARKWDPVTISGVIASSSPLTHLYDFWQFNDQVATTFSQVGGGLCYNKVRQGFADIRQAMRTPEGRRNVSSLFQLNPRLDQTPLNYNDVQIFYLLIIAPFQQIVQFNNDFNISISDMCTTIDKSTWTNMEVVRQAYVYLSTTITGSVQPMVTSYQTIVNDLGNQSASSPYLDQRMWQYQTCTEFGWFYTTNNNENGLFGAVVPGSLFLNQCFDIFPDANLTATSIRDLVIEYNNYYGSAFDYSGTNAVFTNGLLDPWTILGKKSTGDFSVVPYIIPGASFASDMFPGDTNNSFIIHAHALMAENINVWVNGPRNPKTFVNTTIPWTRPQSAQSVNLRESVLKQEIESRFSKLGDDVPSKKTFPEPKFKKVFLGRPPHGFLPEPDYELKEDAYPPGFEQGTFRQRQDHFDNQNADFFQQKFFKNAQWAKQGGPNFLMIGGEGPESARWVLNENITYLTWAKKYGATVYLLEHRFYGDSVVGDNTNFKLLNSLQMLYDLAEFIKAVNIRTGTSNPWITFGGSYSGAMSAWMREVFPDLVVGAVASSGPVYAKTDFYEYLMVVENSVRRYNSKCADNIQSGFDAIRTLFLTKEGRQNLSSIFQLQPPFSDSVTDTDQHYFFSNVYGNFQGAVQYSGDNTGPYANGYGIPDMCKIMSNDSNTPLNNIVAFNQFMIIFYNGGQYTGMDNNYQNMITYLKTAQHYGPDSAAGLLWTWQTCSEFGYFQSADSGNGIFGSPTPVNMYVQMCMDVFNNQYQRTSIDYSIANTNYKYGERFHYRGTNVVLPNGNVDPWHALGLYYPTDSSVVSYLIDGTAHCADMYPARDADVPGLKVVRDLVDQNIAKWLNQSPATGATQIPGTGSTAKPGTGSTSQPVTASTVQATTKSTSSATITLSFIAIFARYLL